jgi:hypothetical protein
MLFFVEILAVLLRSSAILRHLYLFQSELAGAELMYQRALQGKEKATDQATVLGICRCRQCR